MNSHHSGDKSSILTSLPFIVLFGAFGIYAAFRGSTVFALPLLILFALTLISRLWTYLCSHSLSANLRLRNREIFPGESTDIEILLENRKIFPIPYISLYMPLSKKLSLIPEYSRDVNGYEKDELLKLNASIKTVGEKNLGRLLWYEKTKYKIRLSGKRRGITSLSSWTINTGAGFGLSENNTRFGDNINVVVYPEITDINIRPFLKNLWNSAVGPKGVMEDLTVIRSTRDYQNTDNYKHINWRLLARGQNLTVNTYEDILPNGIHILLDGESFSGPQYKEKELEETLSIISSIMLRLEEKRVRVYLSLPKSLKRSALTIAPEEGTRKALYEMATYDVQELEIDKAGTAVIEKRSEFNLNAIISTSYLVGHFYYFTYDSSVYDQKLLGSFESDKTTIISCIKKDNDDLYEVISLDSLKLKRRENE